MAEPLKNNFGPRVPRAIARQIKTAWPDFRDRKFLADVLTGFDGLELMDRGREIARALARHLPEDYPLALDILMRSVGEHRPGDGPAGSMASFFYLPHTHFVAEFGIGHFELSMAAQHKLTQLFTAEFSIRPFLMRYERESLALLREWTADPSEHVRRLVSEGTRPRLPWGQRLPSFQKNPAPVIALLELLKDDSEIYVRRSVANNLNDIGKDNPDTLLHVARRWMKGASAERQSLVRHSLRSLVKEGNADALAILGFGGKAAVRVENVRFAPKRVKRGGKVAITFTLRSTSKQSQRLIVDLRVNFVKANGSSSPKIFRLKAIDLAPRETATFRKTVSLADLTTRKHYPGLHEVAAQVNGRVFPLGAFRVAGDGHG
jgi:3-methyladenine DNA glycosylase AlkC